MSIYLQIDLSRQVLAVASAASGIGEASAPAYVRTGAWPRGQARSQARKLASSGKVRVAPASERLKAGRIDPGHRRLHT